MDKFNRNWITENSLEVIDEYEKGVLTLRGLHYRLVARGMTNTLQHYKRVVSAMKEARWEGTVSFDTFSDHDRQMLGETPYEETTLESKVDRAKIQIRLWMHNYSKNYWENQEYYPEVFIEKKALQGVFQPVCERFNVTLGACKGYPSLTFLHETSLRLRYAGDTHEPIILYFGDYDPSGEDIPRSIEENLSRMGIDIEVRRIALMEDQVIKWNLPPAPIKAGDSRSANWSGLGQVELDAIEPKQLQELCTTAIQDVFDEDTYNELMEAEAEESERYREKLKKYVKDLEL